MCFKRRASLCVSAVHAGRSAQPCRIPTLARDRSSTTSAWVAAVMRIPCWSAGAGSLSPATATAATRPGWFALSPKVRPGVETADSTN